MTAPTLLPTSKGNQLAPAEDNQVDQEDPRVLTARLQTIRRQRIADEHEAVQLPQLLRAIALSRRDRDAGTSRQLLNHRAQLERLWANVEDLVITSARVAVRTELHNSDPDDPVTHDAQQALRRAHHAIQALGEALGAQR